MGRKRTEYTRDELVQKLREVAAEHGSRISIKRFTRHTGISETVIYRHFDCWGDVREEAGLERRLKHQPWYSKDDLLREFHKVVWRLRRFPTAMEFSKYAACTVGRLYERFGGLGETIVAYRKWVQRTDWEERLLALDDIKNPQQEAEPAVSVAWMQDAWFRLRVGFLLTSGEYRDHPAGACDLLVVLKDDWPECPVSVLEFGLLGPLPERIQPLRRKDELDLQAVERFFGKKERTAKDRERTRTDLEKTTKDTKGSGAG